MSKMKDKAIEQANAEPQLTERDYKMALGSQDACNAIGLIHALNDVAGRVSRDNDNTKDRNTHPIIRLYVEQLYHLSEGHDPESYPKAHNACSEGAGE